jgi:uncharacterized protein (TIGR02145 family)
MQYATLLLFLCVTLLAPAQRVSNVTAEQQGQDLLIHYHLEAEGPVEVKLYISNDLGKSWEGPLKSCTGDVGPNVAPGTGKRIRWDVLQDRELVGDGITFKVVAKGGAEKKWLNPALTYGSVTDIDGNTYATIQIGTQVWMAENLRTARYRNGDAISNVTDDIRWGNLSSGAWCHYENDPEYEVPNGKLYNCYAVADSRKVCPAGWHVPTDAEWQQLESALGMPAGELGQTGVRGEAQNLGGKMKATTNSSGFTGLPGGYRDFTDGRFKDLGYIEFWWSASESVFETAWFRRLDKDNAGITRDIASKRYGVYLRCIRD